MPEIGISPFTVSDRVKLKKGGRDVVIKPDLWINPGPGRQTLEKVIPKLQP